MAGVRGTDDWVRLLRCIPLSRCLGNSAGNSISREKANAARQTLVVDEATVACDCGIDRGLVSPNLKPVEGVVAIMRDDTLNCCMRGINFTCRREDLVCDFLPAGYQRSEISRPEISRLLPPPRHRPNSLLCTYQPRDPQGRSKVPAISCPAGRQVAEMINAFVSPRAGYLPPPLLSAIDVLSIERLIPKRHLERFRAQSRGNCARGNP